MRVPRSAEGLKPRLQQGLVWWEAYLWIDLVPTILDQYSSKASSNFFHRDGSMPVVDTVTKGTGFDCVHQQ
jgi:hypothetical protein